MPHNAIVSVQPFAAAPRPHDMGRLASVRSLMLIAIVLALVACATQRTHAPVSRRPTKTPSSIPAAPRSGITLVDPAGYEQEKNRLMQELASNSRDSLAPSDVGYYIDVLNGRLKQVLGKNALVTRRGERIALDLPERAGFESASAQISQSARDTLAPVAKALVEYRMTLISVRVGNDGSNAPASNPRLVEQRALAVAHYLADAGVASKRILVVGSGQNHAPAAATGMKNPSQIQLQIEPVVRTVNSEH